MKHLASSSQSRRNKIAVLFARYALIAGAISTLILLFWISTAAVDGDRSGDLSLLSRHREEDEEDLEASRIRDTDGGEEGEERQVRHAGRTCATVEEMGEGFAAGSERESLRVRELIRRHFEIHGAERVRRLPPEDFCRQGFVIGKASEAGFGNEMYKILTAAALSVVLNRSLIIGQTRGLYPFEDYISFSNLSFTLKEVKHLWRKNDCAGKYRRKLFIRIDNFQHPVQTNVLCSDWRVWKQPIIWFQGTMDAVAIQFFLKNVHPGMKSAASVLLGQPESIQSRPNIFGELMQVIISPSQAIEGAVNWVLEGRNPDVVLHMRMLTNRSVRALKAAIMCVKRALNSYQHQSTRPRVVLVSDTPSFIKEITPVLTEFAEVIYFSYKSFKGNISSGRMSSEHQSIGFRTRDWGPAPRWVAFVDFFLASRAKYAFVSGAHRRVGTTFAQLAAALAAANKHGKEPAPSNFSFFSSFQSNLLVNGLASQVGWGHAWNRFAGSLSCHRQPHQCALTPLLPSAWWDGKWQSPIPRDVRKLQEYGVRLTDYGEVVGGSIESHCRTRDDHVRIMNVFG